MAFKLFYYEYAIFFPYVWHIDWRFFLGFLLEMFYTYMV